MLMGRGCDLHAAGSADGVVRHVAVASNLVGGIYDDYPLMCFYGQNTGHFAQHGGLAYAGTPQKKDVFSGKCQVLDYLDGAKDGPAYPAGYANDLASSVSNSGDTV